MELETIFVRFQLVAEIPIACRSLGGDNGNTTGEHRKTKLLLQVEHSLFLQPADDFLPFPHHVTHSKFRIDVINNPREAVLGMELGMHLQHQLHSRMHLLTGNADKVGHDDRPYVAPALGRCPGYRDIPIPVLLYQFHVTMSAVLTDLGEFGFYPVGACQSGIDCFCHHTVQFIERECFLHFIQIPLYNKVYLPLIPLASIKAHSVPLIIPPYNG